jgi:hypothetical protein
MLAGLSEIVGQLASQWSVGVSEPYQPGGETAVAQVGVGCVTYGDTHRLDRRLCCAPRMSHVVRIGSGRHARPPVSG